MTWIYCARHDNAFIQETELCLPCEKEADWARDVEEIEHD